MYNVGILVIISHNASQTEIIGESSSDIVFTIAFVAYEQVDLVLYEVANRYFFDLHQTGFHYKTLL